MKVIINVLRFRVGMSMAIALIWTSAALGNGPMFLGAQYVVGDEPMSVAIGDLNGDHVPDMAVANFWSQDWILSRLKPDFRRASQFTISGSRTYRLWFRADWRPRPSSGESEGLSLIFPGQRQVAHSFQWHCQRKAEYFARMPISPPLISLDLSGLIQGVPQPLQVFKIFL